MFLRLPHTVLKACTDCVSGVPGSLFPVAVAPDALLALDRLLSPSYDAKVGHDPLGHQDDQRLHCGRRTGGNNVCSGT